MSADPWWANDPFTREFIASGKCGCAGCKQRRKWLAASAALDTRVAS